MRAVDSVDNLKSERPILGVYGKLDYDAARKSRLAECGNTVEKVTQDLVQYCSGLTIWGHPKRVGRSHRGDKTRDFSSSLDMLSCPLSQYLQINGIVLIGGNAQ